MLLDRVTPAGLYYAMAIQLFILGLITLLGQIVLMRELIVAFSGFLASALFAFAGLDNTADQQSAVPRLLASDLLGGCAGSAAASLAVIPFLGMDQTAAMVALLATAVGLMI